MSAQGLHNLFRGDAVTGVSEIILLLTPMFARACLYFFYVAVHVRSIFQTSLRITELEIMNRCLRII